MDSTRAAHARHAGTPSEALPSALARIYARAVERYQQNQMTEGPTPESNGRDGTMVQEDFASVILPD